jgi:transposase
MAADKGEADGTGVPGHGGDGAEVAEASTQVVEYAAAIDVAKGSGMVCTRVPGSRADRRRQGTWRVGATFTEVTALMDHLRCEGIQRLVLESTSGYWRIWYYLAEAAGLEVWLVNARDVKHLPGGAKATMLPSRWGKFPVRRAGPRPSLRGPFLPLGCLVQARVSS